MLLLRYGAAALLTALPFFSTSFAQSIALDKQDATVWAQEQVISGHIVGGTGTLYVNEVPIPLEGEEGRFAVPVRLGAGETSVVACTAEPAVCTDPLRLTLGFTPRPEIELRAGVEGRTIELTGEVLDNPSGGALSYSWSAAPTNPFPVTLTVTGDLTASGSIPSEAPTGEYTFEWVVRAEDGGQRVARTFVTVHADGTVEPFDMEHDHAAWVDRAVIYGIAPYYFVRNAPSRFEAIRQKLPELAELGVNTLWLQPVFRTAAGGQSYDVTDFFSVWSGFGTEEQLQSLIDTAHGLGMRVLFDLVPNHTAISHPYAQDAVAHGPRSHYFDFYQREFDGAPYARHYNSRRVGEMTFVYYFWNDLVNLNYDNPEVQRHMIEASLYWVEHFGIDGYRVDVAWGPNARTPEFFPEWRLALKRVRPDLLLLGEDKATRPDVFDRRFDAAYDWAPGEGWVSEWMWQTTFSENSNPTIFNTAPMSTRAQRLRAALTNRGEGWAPDAKVLRFMENNDTFRFLATHSLEQTRMAAALLFSLPGIPLMYNGQEVGFANHPYQTNSIFSAGSTIESRDTRGLFRYYQYLLRLREAFPSLYSDNFAEVGVSPAVAAGRTFAYRRWEGDEHIVGAINMGTPGVTATLSLPTPEMGLDSDATYYVTDLFTGVATTRLGSELATVEIDVPAYTTVLFAVTDEPIDLPVSEEPRAPSAPEEFTLAQNYPNPFTGQTTLSFSTAQGGRARLTVIDVLGREVAVLLDEHVPAGSQTVTFDGSAFASGAYFSVLEWEGRRAIRQMMLVR